MRQAISSVIVLVGLLIGSTATASDPALERVVKRTLPTVLGLYKWLHAHPELSGEEQKTSARLAQELKKIGMRVEEGVGGTGFYALLEGKKKKSKTVALYRADMDALPIIEATGLSYASENKGVMHACGHDIHMATAFGTLSVLAETSDQWAGTLLFVAQPAEETGRGARDMLRDRKFNALLRKIGKPKVAFGIHTGTLIPAGSVSLVSGFSSANVDSVDITLFGKGGHGARPNEAIDPIVIGSEIVLALQTIVSRRLKPGEKAVVTVGSFVSGTKHNVIPPSAKMMLTVRSYTSETRKRLMEEIKHITKSIAAAHHAPKDPIVKIRDEFTPAGYNDPVWTDRLTRVFRNTIGAANVSHHEPSMGGEDFSRYGLTLKIPAVMWRLGTTKASLFRSRSTRKNIPGLHSDRYAPDPKPSLSTGMLTMIAAIRSALD